MTRAAFDGQSVITRNCHKWKGSPKQRRLGDGVKLGDGARKPMNYERRAIHKSIGSRAGRKCEKRKHIVSRRRASVGEAVRLNLFTGATRQEFGYTFAQWRHEKFGWL